MAVLLLVAVVGIVTATVLQTTSTEIQISGNHRQAVQEFYAAEAGLAEARSRLRKTTGSEAYFIGDEASPHDASWTSYIVTSSDWSLPDDPGYSKRDTHVFPLADNPANTVMQPNSVQTDLPYWVKIRHKTEYDARQAGHDSSTPHYVDLDGRHSRPTKTHRGNIIYFGYPSTADSTPTSFTTKTPPQWLPVEKIVAHGAASGSVILEEEVFHPPGPNQIAALYASGAVNLAGTAGAINGHDACRVVDSLPPVVFGTTFTKSSAIQFDGTPASSQLRSDALALEEALATLNADAVILNEDQTGQHLGTAQVPMVFFAASGSFSQPQGIRIQQTGGFGLLLVDGNATLAGAVQWDGMVLVTGTLSLQGEDSRIAVRGGVWAGRVDQQAGSFTVQYNSCLLQSALLAVPARVRTWKEVLS